MSLVTGPIVKIISHSNPEAFYTVSGGKIHYLLKGQEEKLSVSTCFEHPEGKKWTSVAALSLDEKLMAVCDAEKNLFLFEIKNYSEFKLLSVPMRLAKTATSVKFTNFPSERTLLVADKFGDVLRFQLVEEFDRWARESQMNSKTLSIHTKKNKSSEDNEKKRPREDETDEIDETCTGTEIEDSSSEAHHCTIIGHISMVTDLQVLPIGENPNNSLIVTCDRDEKVRLTRADFPERIHSFALGHTEFVGSLTVCAATRSIYSAGGDKFIAEWSLEGPSNEPSQLNLRLKSKIQLNTVDGAVVQEIKVNEKGDCLLVHVDQVGLLLYTKSSSDDWTLKAEVSIKTGITAIDFDKSGESFYYASWSPSEGFEITFMETSLSFPEDSFDKFTAESGKEMISLLSKGKLRKDIERIDWKQKKHANQKPRD